MSMVTNASLHFQIIKGIIENGYAPEAEALSKILEASTEEVSKGLYELQEYHGVVLQFV